MSIRKKIAQWPIRWKDVAPWAEPGPGCRCLRTWPADQGALGVRGGASSSKPRAELGVAWIVERSRGERGDCVVFRCPRAKAVGRRT
eukprot:318788-Alexandrium_andersonii.AAC.1